MLSGLLLSILPVLYFFAKPLVGFICDYFSVRISVQILENFMTFFSLHRKFEN